MNRRLTPLALKDYIAAPPNARAAFDKQVKLLVGNLHHHSLRAKKYDVARNVWQARINRNWRFYSTIESDTYIIARIIPHPK